jgi:hypothetical protein
LNRIECHFWAIGEFVINKRRLSRLGRLAKAMVDINLRNRNRGGGPIAQIEARRRVACPLAIVNRLASRWLT